MCRSLSPRLCGRDTSSISRDRAHEITNEIPPVAGLSIGQSARLATPRARRSQIYTTHIARAREEHIPRINKSLSTVTSDDPTCVLDEDASFRFKSQIPP